MNFQKPFSFLRLTNKSSKIVLFDYLIADKLFRVFTIFWIFYVITIYQERSLFPDNLFFPQLWFQKLFLNELPSKLYFFSIATVGILCSVLSIIKKNIIYRLVLCFCLLWLNAFIWSFGSISHSGHLFVLTHLYSVFLVCNKSIDEKKFAQEINYFQFGILFTYSIAGLWKLLFLVKDFIYPKMDTTTWLDLEAVKTNAIINLLDKDVIISDKMVHIYEIPYIWQIASLGTFFIQLIAVLGVWNRNFLIPIILGLISFHLYNQFFTLTNFYPAIFTLLIVFFPYHLFKKT